MQLRLKYAPAPENAGLFAADIVGSAAQVSGVELDYTPESLALVDGIFDEFRADGVTSEQLAETLFGFGCYVGEVLTRNAGGRWRATTEQEQALAGWPMMVELGEQRWCNPIAKAFKRLDNGPEDSLRYFYTVFASGGAH
ncbi:DUF6278 family protein [Actinoplanes sp. CA-142083]|uniref:DUF6278 family protein n=1 Tax=Actinoplanes sp. CA-142083 TaxID=3239903 RepID=UPI003D8BC77E